MNCRDLDHLTESQSFGSLSEEDRHDAEAHANSCHHCAPLWVAYARLAAVRVPPMPAELATRCRELAAASEQRSVLRFAPRGMTLAVGGFVVLAAAAGALTVHLVRTSAPQRVDDVVAPPQAVAPVAIAQPPPPPPPPLPVHIEKGEPDMNKSKAITAAAVAVGAAVAQAQEAPPAERRIKTAEEIVATNDLNKDGIVLREEATKVNGNLLLMWSVYDMDHDNKLDVVELKRALGEVEAGTALDKITGNSGGNMAAARPELIMANNDLNKDGIITKEEAKTAGKALFRMWDGYDINRDGKLDLAELAKGSGY